MMKTFEEYAEGKWYCEGDHAYEDNEITWRAALKWVQKTAKELVEQDAPICMGDVIKHELEN
ncbi:hypothetical protein LCGC14_1343460 [marine sediment metagenome]|uniref:Uncharacterized protein n=1 Tax=marine sediment metagenome TaxID=412755 RepID=A0A0F9NFE3_9ZZZZ